MLNTAYNMAYNTASVVPNFLGFERTPCLIDFNAVHPDDHMPLMNQKIKVFSQFLFYKWEIGVYETDRYGKLSLSYNCIKLPFQSSQTLIFQVFEESMATKSRLTIASDCRLVFESTQILPLGKAVIKDLEVPLYEFEKDFPRLKMPDDEALRAQQWNIVDYYRIIKAALPGFATNALTKLIGLVWGDLSIEEIRSIQNIKKLDLAISPATTLDIVLNGICPNLKQVGENAYVSEIKWKNYAFNNEKDMPDAALYAYKDDKGKLKIEKITLQYRGEEMTSHTPEDVDFNKTLFKFNSLALTKGSLAHHLGTHMEVGQYTIAIKQQINKNPIGRLLEPFLRGVLEINQKALTVIIKTLMQSGLTEKGAWDNLKEAVGGRCWSNFDLQKPINEDHHLAHGSKLFSDKTFPNIDRFINENEAEILEYWYEIEAYNEVIVKNCLPYQPYDDREDVRGVEDREVIDGIAKSVRPLKDLEDLRRFSKYLALQASWGHWTLHISEKIGLDPNFSRFAPDTLSEKDLIAAIENQITLGKTLTNYHDGSLIDNPNGDIYQPIIDDLSTEFVKQQFAALGYKIHKTFYGTII